MNDGTAFEDPSPESPRFERWAWLAWGMLILLGLAAFELLHQPALLGATISLKFAWSDAKTAFWLRSRDPNRPRGTAHFWIYLGYGLWKAAICGFVLTFVFIWIDQAMHGKPANRPPNQRNEVLTLLFAGTCMGSAVFGILSGAICCVGFVIALRNGVKLWLNSQLAGSRVQDHWPPAGGAFNHLGRILLPSALLSAAVVLGGLILAMVLVLVGDRNAPPPWMAMVAILIPLLVLPVAGLLLNDWLKNRLTAADVFEAWPDEESPIGA